MSRIACGLTAVAVVVFGLLSPPAGADPVTLKFLIDNAGKAAGTITGGDKEFSDFRSFSSVATGGAARVDPATVTVTTINNGLVFQSPSFEVGMGETLSTAFAYTVTRTDLNKEIVGATLDMNTFGRRGGSRLSVSEALTGLLGTDLGSNIVFSRAARTRSSDRADFAPFRVLNVSNGINLVGSPTQAGSDASVSQFTEVFIQEAVPEPSPLLMGGAAALAALVLRRLRRPEPEG